MGDPFDILSRLRRNANSTSSTSSEEDLFSESNNLAMFVVIPVMVIVYGGCACIYCCYKCRRYMKENRPFQDLADKIRGRETAGNNEETEITDEASQHDHPDEESRLESSQEGEKLNLDEDANEKTRQDNTNVHSNHSSPGPEGAIRYVDYDTDLRSAMSTPGMQYKRNGSVKSKRMKLSTPIAVVYNENDAELRSDSGIMEDAALSLVHSDSRSSRQRMLVEAPLSIEEIDNPAVETTGSSTSKGNTQEAAKSETLARYISTSEIAIQTDDSGFQKRGASNIKSKSLKDYVVVAKYMNWRKTKKGSEKERTREHSGFFTKSDTKHSLSSDSGVSVISGHKMSDSVSRGASMFEMSSRSRNACAPFTSDKYSVYNSRATNRYANQPLKKTQTSLTNNDLKKFIIGPWK